MTGRGAAPSGLQAHAGVTGVVVATTGDGVDARVLISVWLREWQTSKRGDGRC